MPKQPMDPKTIIRALIAELKREHPDETLDQLFEHYQKRLARDPVLREAATLGAFNMVSDEIRNHLVREGKELPPELTKPH